jgi:mono/diheme cytochrome c family protein
MSKTRGRINKKEQNGVISANNQNQTVAKVFAILCLLIYGLLLNGCDYARMKDDEAIDTYEIVTPDMPKHTIPAAGGGDVLSSSDPLTPVNPLPSDADSLARGKEAYGFYCIHCHGPEGDGYGTVGQSFSPLPADLRSSQVQEQSDGELFSKISRGYKRHPPLAYTVAESDRWAVINYLRSIARPVAKSP